MIKGFQKLDWLSKMICRIVAVAVGGCVIVLLVWSIYYVRLVGQLTVLQIDKATQEIKERVERDNRAIEEMEKFNRWQERAK